MTEEDVLSIIANGYPMHSNVRDEAMEIIVPALKKQIKRSDVKMEGHKCLCCGRLSPFGSKFCLDCGRRIENEVE